MRVMHYIRATYRFTKRSQFCAVSNASIFIFYNRPYFLFYHQQ